MAESVRIWSPGSLSNLGPGFDTIGVALEGIGDLVEVSLSDRPGITLLRGGGVWEPPSNLDSNTGARAAGHVLKRFPGRAPGLNLRVTKGIRPGSGLGSSAASAAGAALGALTLLTELNREEAVEAALFGEAGVSGAIHGDNVLPSLLGGFVLTASSDPGYFRRVPIPVNVHFAVVRPDVEVLTKQARALLPKQVALRDAVHNASSLAFLIDALRSGDLVALGRAIEQDRIVEPVRATLVPGYARILQAARGAGALGAALSGSGPAMFAVCEDARSAAVVRDAMVQAAQEGGLAAVGIATRVDPVGSHQTTMTSHKSVI